MLAYVFEFVLKLKWKMFFLIKDRKNASAVCYCIIFVTEPWENNIVQMDYIDTIIVSMF